MLEQHFRDLIVVASTRLEQSASPRCQILSGIWIRTMIQQQLNDMSISPSGCVGQRADARRIKAFGKLSVSVQQSFNLLLIPQGTGRWQCILCTESKKVTGDHPRVADRRMFSATSPCVPIVEALINGQLKRRASVGPLRINPGSQFEEAIDQVELPRDDAPMDRIIAKGIAGTSEFG